jgi:SAM-dependent methyltransferase
LKTIHQDLLRQAESNYPRQKISFCRGKLDDAINMCPQPETLSECSDIAVRDFYDRYPYPRPVDGLDDYKRRWQDRQRRRSDFHLFWPGLPYREDHTILVAGCGTSQAAKHALRWPEAQVTGIDCSATSVRHTKQLKQSYELRNLQVHQVSIENVSDLGMSFDQVVCTGVLHHLADPDAGLDALRSVLNPDGAMQLMVYAPYGRAGVYMLQEFCQRIGVRPGDREIRDLCAALSALPTKHPLQTLLTQAPDFRNEAALADALLNPKDRAYSVSQFFEFIQRAGLRFGRWIRQAPYSVGCGAIASIPQASKIGRLPLNEQFAAIELFRGTMIRHSAVVYRNDSRSNLQQVDFTDDEWIDYVPIRMPDTICLEDRLPSGTAAVLINRTHTFTDLFLPIKQMEKRIFDAIDGHRSIRNIVEQMASSSPQLELVRTFFERLWWHDQVVFATSQKTG